MATRQDPDGRSRFAKLGLAINDELTQAYRDILEMEVSPACVLNRVKSSGIFQTLYPDQLLLLGNAKNVGFKDFDISLLYKLLRSICTRIQKPTNGWGGNTMPAEGDTTVGDDIERIRLIRNNLFGHVSSASTSLTTFNNYWTIISEVCRRLQTYTAKNYLDALNNIQTQSMEECEEAIIEKIKVDCEKEKLLLEQVSSLVSDMQEIKVALWSERKAYSKPVVSNDPKVRSDDAENTDREESSAVVKRLLHSKYKEIELLEKQLSKYRVPKNLVIMGPQGVGKSSFINSVIASFSSNCWREWTKVGDFDDCRYGERVTRQLIKISKDDYLDSERQKKFHYPTLIDINGFQDIFLEKLIVLLRYVLFGLITDKHELLDALKFYGYNDIKQAMTYLSKQEKMRVDGLTVVTSAVSSLPHNILNAVKQVAVKEMEVPVFGVLTELDKVNDWEALAIKKKEFCSKLGLPETRLLLCTNYCDDYDKCSGNSRLNQVHPELDVPILSFMRQVCDIVNIHTKLKVIHSSEVILCSALQGPRMRAQLQGASSRNEQELVTMEYSNFVYNSGPVYSDLALAMGLVCVVLAIGYLALTK
ncbi:uncharacterized protein LOC133201212 [Saccostrea echinata]|uniref:uncharacterized protein LOC133201212 n=1 Tax=Saccostrea echinata TaxID=191078 RepID=UPI002A800E1C|nr:uncharacterized protein LOC133201212 [Saccostrea echinata]